MVLPSHTRSRAKHAREPIPNDSRYVQYRVLLGLEKQDCAVSEIEVDKVFRLMRNKASEVPPYYTMPCCSLALIEFFLYVLGNILLNMKFVHRLRSNFDSLLLHLFRHINGLDLRFQLFFLFGSHFALTVSRVSVQV